MRPLPVGGFHDKRRSLNNMKVLDSANSTWQITDEAGWWSARKAEGFDMFIFGAPLEWGTTTPWWDIQRMIGLAKTAGMYIAAFSRQPRHWEAALDAIEPHTKDLIFFNLDIETTGYSGEAGEAPLQSVIDGIRDRGVTPIIYSSYYMWNDMSSRVGNHSVTGQPLAFNRLGFGDVPYWESDTDSGITLTNWNPDIDTPRFGRFGLHGWEYDDRVGVQQRFAIRIPDTTDVTLSLEVDLNTFKRDWVMAQVTRVTGKPGTLTATALAKSVALSWGTPPPTNTAVTDYTVQYKLTSSGTWLTFSHTASTATSITVTGLTAGSSYDFRVAAVNAAGISPWSNTVTITPYLIVERWTGTNGAAWSSQWLTTHPAPTGVLDINGNRGRATSSVGSYAIRFAYVNEIVTDFELLISLAVGDVLEQYPEIYYRVGGFDGFGWLHSAYDVSNQIETDKMELQIIGSNATLSSVPVSLSSTGSSTTARRWVRIRVVGDNHKIRWWLDGATEPSTWQIDHTDFGSEWDSGFIALGFYNDFGGNTKVCEWDDLTVMPL